MGAEIIHHDHICRAQLRTQDFLQIGKKDLPVGGRFDGHRRNHTPRADGAQDGEHLPSAVRRGLMNALASRTTRIEPCHLRRDTTFVQINQPFRRTRADLFDELRTPLPVGFGVPFLGVE